MNVKVKMPQPGRMKNGGWKRELLLSIVATTISIALTFGTASFLEKRQQKENRKEVAILIVNDLRCFSDNMKGTDTASFIPRREAFARLAEMSADSIRGLSEEEARPYFAALMQDFFVFRDKSIERVYSSSISTFRDLGTFEFIRWIGACYIYVNEIEDQITMQRKLIRELGQKIIMEFASNERPFDGKILYDVLQFKETKYLMHSLYYFMHNYEAIIGSLDELTSYCMEVIDITEEDLERFRNNGIKQ